MFSIARTSYLLGHTHIAIHSTPVLMTASAVGKFLPDELVEVGTDDLVEFPEERVGAR